jgi:hypothetical protein
MLKRLEKVGDRLLSRFVPNATAAASCPCGPYPYTGPCYYWQYCGNGYYRLCYCERSAAYIACSACVY